jgi:UDP-N-acetylglucosamine 1-carboxyvinyltransferase
MYLLEASVTGTETALLAAAQAKGITEIRNAACEPHVAELCTFLRAMGARVDGIGMSTIRIEAPSRLRGAIHTLRGDYIEAASWAVVGAVTGGDVEVTGVHAEDLEPIAAVLAEMHLEFELSDQRFAVGPSSLVGARRITTGLWPGFPSDIVSLVTVLATQAQGQTLVHDWMYELRLFALEQLSAMRGDLFLCDPHRIIVSGPTKLRGRKLDSRDIRSGMALIAAALVAEGESTVLEVETVERGYGDLVARLRLLGADVVRQMTT